MKVENKEQYMQKVAKRRKGYNKKRRRQFTSDTAKQSTGRKSVTPLDHCMKPNHERRFLNIKDCFKKVTRDDHSHDPVLDDQSGLLLSLEGKKALDDANEAASLAERTAKVNAQTNTSTGSHYDWQRSSH